MQLDFILSNGVVQYPHVRGCLEFEIQSIITLKYCAAAIGDPTAVNW